MEWIMDWSRLDDAKSYLVVPVDRREDGTWCLGGAGTVYLGNWVRAWHIEGCYAAVALPPFDYDKVWGK